MSESNPSNPAGRVTTAAEPLTSSLSRERRAGKAILFKPTQRHRETVAYHQCPENMTYEKANGDYAAFISEKAQVTTESGPAAAFLPDCLFDFQRQLVEWAFRKKRAAIFADCGLGKTIMQLVWAQNVIEQENKSVLILTPLAVSHQTVREAEKFGIGADLFGKPTGKGITVANYEKLHHFNADDFAGVVCDESSILKNFDGKTKAAITEFMRTRPYRLLCTATAAPNDFVELGTSSEALGYLGYADMLAMFFKQATSKDHLGWGRTKYLIRDHAKIHFWRWVSSWSMAIRKPSDMGCSDDGFDLPRCRVSQTVVDCSRPRDGMLFVVPARSLPEQREERRLTLNERCERVASMVEDKDCAVAWCHLNDEGDRLEKLIPEAVQVSGKDSDDAKEEKLLAFQQGQARFLITKPKISGFGLNWQHCAFTTMFPSHSFEQYYQAVRRFWRFGQTRDVQVEIVTTPGEEAVLGNLTRKAEQADEMFDSLLAHMHEAMRIERDTEYTKKAEVPSWL